MLKVRCPKCGHTQNTQTLKTVKCHRCGSGYQVVLKSKNKTRIVKIIKGTQLDVQKEFYKQGLYRKGKEF